MKFVCLGYGEEKDWDKLSKTEQDAWIEECFDYDEKLLKQGHWLDAGQALEAARTAKTLRWTNGKVVVTDGPFAETKEQLGGLGVLEARDMDHAVELVSKHPGLRLGGPFEIRPIDEETMQRLGAADRALPSRDARPESTRFASLGYIAPEKFGDMAKSELDDMMNQCVAFDEQRVKNGQWLAGIKLQDVRQAKTLRHKNGKVIVTDGPFAETKEQLGGVVALQLNDMRHAVELLSQHPALRYGVTIEVRPTDEEMNARWEARRNRVYAS